MNESTSLVQDEFFRVPDDETSVIRFYSRSFSLASRWLPADIRNDAEKLYAWCRWCDEAVDSAPSAHVARTRLECLRNDVDRIFDGQTVLHPASQWLVDLVNSKGIRQEDALALLTGMEMDINPWQVRDEEELLRYCYHAAGVVGRMMCQIMGVHGSVAMNHAVDLGIAMQLTNIARDVKEDWERGRCYIPLDVDHKTELDRNEPPSNERVRESVERSLIMAEDYYASGLAGVSYLPKSCRPAICLAANVYREIGREIQRQDYRVMDHRVKVTRLRLAWIGCRAFVGNCIPDFKLPWRGKNSSPQFLKYSLTSVSGDSVMKDARYLAYLGISLTCFMGTALFAMVAFNPKDSSYSSLPLIYAVGCLLVGVVTNLLARRQARPLAAVR